MNLIETKMALQKLQIRPIAIVGYNYLIICTWCSGASTEGPHISTKTSSEFMGKKYQVNTPLVKEREDPGQSYFQ